MRRGREDIGVSFVGAAVESGVSTREGGVCRCLALRGFFDFGGVEGVEEVIATEDGESARTEEVALSVATASSWSVGSDFDSEIVSRSAAVASIFGDVIFDIFGLLVLPFRQALLFLYLRFRGIEVFMYSMWMRESLNYIIVCLLVG